MKDSQLSVSEAQRARDDLAARLKEFEKKVKTIEGDLAQAQEEVTNAERARRAAESDRDELQDELSTVTSKVYVEYINNYSCTLDIVDSSDCSNSLSEEKRRIEGRISTLEEDLEEEQMNSESAVEKARKAQQQVDAMQADMSTLQSNLSKAESVKSQLEKQVCVCVCTHTT